MKDLERQMERNNTETGNLRKDLQEMKMEENESLGNEITNLEIKMVSEAIVLKALNYMFCMVRYYVCACVILR